jgi:peptide/nickel transport system permease protein
MLIAVLIAVPVGVVSATRQDGWLDYTGRLFSIGGLSIPDFVLGTLIVLYPAIWWGWTAPYGFVAPWANPWINVQQVFFPALILGIRTSAVSMRLVRAAMLDVTRQDYIRTANAKGLGEREIIYGHALRNALLPVVTVMGEQFGHLLAGTVVIETIFNLPGVGRLTVDAIAHRDYTQLQGNVLFVAVIFIVVTIMVDLSYLVIDPRIRLA